MDPKQREECGDNEELKEDIIYDPTEWTLPEKLHTYVENLSEENQLTNEDKILLIFEKLCKDYVYDDNLISYIKRWMMMYLAYLIGMVEILIMNGKKQRTT